MIRVVILTSGHEPFASRIFHKQARSLMKAGYDVTLVVPYDRNEIVDGVRIIALPKPRNRFQRIFGLSFIISLIAIREKGNVYHFHDPALLLVGLLIKLFSRAKVIYDVHENVKKDILTKTWIPASCRKGLSCVYTIAEAIVIRFIDYIVIAEDSYIENYKNHRNVISIRNYPLIEYDQLDKSQKPYFGSARSKVLVYVGSISKERGAVELLESLNLLIKSGSTDIFLRLIGPIHPNLRRELCQIAKGYGIVPHISIPGTINHREVFGELIKSDIGLAILHPIPNYVESLPIKLFEYMLAMLPVIASNFPLWKSIVEGHSCGLTVDPANPQEIAASIRYLLEKPELMEEMGKNGRKSVLEKYNWEQESKKLLHLYADILGLEVARNRIDGRESLEEK